MRKWLPVLLIIGVAFTTRAGAVPHELITTVLPSGSVAAGGCFDASGTLHVVVARGAGVSYARRPSGARELEVVSAIPADDPPAFVGDRVPRIAVHPTGKIFVLWQNRKGLALVTSVDSGRTWSAIPAASIVGTSGVDVPTMALALDGTIHVLWVDERDPALPDDAIAKHLYLASSTDAGKTFSTAHRVTTDSARACPCCTPAITAGTEGRLWVAYRSSVKDVKETAMLASTDAGQSFQGRILTYHGWTLQGCPMSGPSIAAAGEALALTWTSEGDMFTSVSRDGGKTWSAPERLGRGKFNRAVANGAGQTLRLWDEGSQTGVWWGDEARPAPRLNIKPAGALVVRPDQRFELLLVDAPAGAPMHHGPGQHGHGRHGH